MFWIAAKIPSYYVEFLATWLIVSYELSPAIAGGNLSMNETEKNQES